MKKLLALLLAVFIAAGCVPAGYAAEEEVSEEITRAVEFGFALGVLENDKFGNFNLEISATRADFAKMLLRILAVKPLTVWEFLRGMQIIPSVLRNILPIGMQLPQW